MLGEGLGNFIGADGRLGLPLMKGQPNPKAKMPARRKISAPPSMSYLSLKSLSDRLKYISNLCNHVDMTYVTTRLKGKHLCNTVINYISTAKFVSKAFSDTTEALHKLEYGMLQFIVFLQICQVSCF